MNGHVMKVMEYEKVKESLKEYAVSKQAEGMLERLQPSIDKALIETCMQETTEARNIIDVNASIPLSAMENMEEVLIKTDKDIALTADELVSVKKLLDSVKKMQRYMNSMQTIGPVIASYAASMYDLPEIYDEIDRCIINGRVDDRATGELNRLRKKIAVTEDKMKQKLNSILSSSKYAGMIQDALVTTRNNRFVVPVKREYRKSIAGNILDMSSSGSTLFIEPEIIAGFQDELNILKIAEEKEVFRVLSYLTEMVAANARAISINMEAMVNYDYIFAKAKYSQALNGFPVKLNTCNIIRIKGGRHPFLGANAVPLDFEIGEDYRALIITGPNTGGKTVALKTVGLMTLMVQSGLHVPVQADSEFAVFTDILADIGDGQSIEQSLSTFSAHVQNIASILECAGSNSLVIMDEIGAGTDPREGMGFAIAVLEETFEQGATILATTHINEIKEFADQNEGFKNGCMEFDIDTLKPRYKLAIGQPGASNAFLIALRLGVDRHIIERAHEISYREKKEYAYGKDILMPQLIDEDTVSSHQEQEESARRIENRNEEIAKNKRDKETRVKRFNKGDCVYISTMKRTGIVYEPENSRGEVVVMVMKKKYRINQKRLSLYVEAEDLYPEDYDLDIVFESKENRKKRKQFSKRHMEGVFIETNEDE